MYQWQESQTIPSVFSSTSQRLLMGKSQDSGEQLMCENDSFFPCVDQAVSVEWGWGNIFCYLGFIEKWLILSFCFQLFISLEPGLRFIQGSGLTQIFIQGWLFSTNEKHHFISVLPQEWNVLDPLVWQEKKNSSVSPFRLVVLQGFGGSGFADCQADGVGEHGSERFRTNHFFEHTAFMSPFDLLFY